MTKRMFPCLIAAFCCALASTASAHHSAEAFYEVSRDVAITGTVTEFRMGNPHARIYLNVTDAGGVPHQWMAEGGSRTVLLREGWKGDEIKIGDKVTIHGNPSRDGTNIVHWIKVDLPDGRQLFGEDIKTDNAARLSEKRRKRD